MNKSAVFEGKKVITILLVLTVVAVFLLWGPSTLFKLKDQLLDLVGVVPCKGKITHDCTCGSMEVTYDSTITRYCCDDVLQASSCDADPSTVYVSATPVPMSAFTTAWVGSTSVIPDNTIRIVFDSPLDENLNLRAAIAVYVDDRLFKTSSPPDEFDEWKQTLQPIIEKEDAYTVSIKRLYHSTFHLIRITDDPISGPKIINPETQWLAFRTS